MSKSLMEDGADLEAGATDGRRGDSGPGATAVVGLSIGRIAESRRR